MDAIYARARFNDLTLMQGHSGSAEANNQRCMLSATKWAIGLHIKLATTVGYFLRDLDLDFANVYMPCWSIEFLFVKSHFENKCLISAVLHVIIIITHQPCLTNMYLGSYYDNAHVQQHGVIIFSSSRLKHLIVKQCSLRWSDTERSDNKYVCVGPMDSQYTAGLGGLAVECSTCHLVCLLFTKSDTLNERLNSNVLFVYRHFCLFQCCSTFGGFLTRKNTRKTKQCDTMNERLNSNNMLFVYRHFCLCQDC